jgi:hypothetical protein
MLTYYNDRGYAQIRIYYCIDDIMPIGSANPDEYLAQAQAKGIDSDSVRSTFGIELSSGLRME